MPEIHIALMYRTMPSVAIQKCQETRRVDHSAVLPHSRGTSQ
jgi:hypothetical protein